MNKILIIIFCLLLTTLSAFAQIGVNTDAPDASSVLDISAYSKDKGFLIPQMTTAQKTAISSPAPGLIVYDTNYKCISQYKDTPSNPGAYEWTCITIFNRHFFYMPSINISTANATGSLLTGTQTIDLYSVYNTGFSAPPIKSTSAPGSIPFFNREQLYYYVTYSDPCITITGINDSGILSYTVNSLPNYDAFVNIVFMLR